MLLTLLGVFAIGYLLGSIPFGVILGKLWRGIDIREYGSGNIGFTNVLRTIGVRAGVVTLIGDIAKGAIPALIGGVLVGTKTAEVGGLVFDEQSGQVVGAVAAVLGHNWSVYLKFKGGKGVDTSLGGLLEMFPWVGLACLAIGIAVIAKTKYVSLGSMAGGISSAAILVPFAVTGRAPVEYMIYALIVAVLILLRHQENIANLRAGTERKLGQKGEKR